MPLPRGGVGVEARKDDPFGQLAWLDERLGALGRTGGKAYIMGHIPPVVDTYNFEGQWASPYAERYMGILQRHRASVVAQLFGHMHCDTVRLFPAAAACPTATALPRGPFGPPLFVSSAVTPIYQNNPSLRVWEYDRGPSKALTGYQTHFAQLEQPRSSSGAAELAWRWSYSSLDSYAALDNTAILETATRLGTDDGLWGRYMGNLWQQPRPPPPLPSTEAEFRVKSVCAMRWPLPRQFAKCVQLLLGTAGSGAGAPGRDATVAAPGGAC